VAILNGDGSSVVETVFVPTLAGLDKGFGEAGVIGGLPVLDKTSCFANWLFQKSSFFIRELTGFLCSCLQDVRGTPPTALPYTLGAFGPDWLSGGFNG
jgi:hypothetical protein